MTTADLAIDTLTMFAPTVAVAPLLAALGSFSFAVTVAVLVSEPVNGFGALAVIVSVTDAPAASGAPAQTTAVAEVTVQPVLVLAAFVRPAGSESFST